MLKMFTIPKFKCTCNNLHALLMLTNVTIAKLLILFRDKAVRRNKEHLVNVTLT